MSQSNVSSAGEHTALLDWSQFRVPGEDLPIGFPIALSLSGFFIMLVAVYLYALPHKISPSASLDRQNVLSSSERPHQRVVVPLKNVKKPSSKRIVKNGVKKAPHLRYRPRSRPIVTPKKKERPTCPKVSVIYFSRHTLYRDPRRVRAQLEKLAAWLKKYPQITVILNGYSDPGGDARYNFILSNKRARKIKKFLIRRGVSPSRLVIRAFGEFASPSAKIKNRQTLRKVVFTFQGISHCSHGE